MERPVVWLALGLASGILLTSKLSFYACLLAGLLLFLAITCSRKTIWLAFTVAMLLGSLLFLLRSPVWPGSYGQQPCKVRVVSARQSPNSTTAVVEVLELNGKKLPWWNHVRAQVTWRQGEVSPGDIVEHTFNWQPPQTPKNPGEFDYAAYQRRKGVLATAFVPQALSGTTHGSNRLAELRTSLQARAAELPGGSGELLATLLLGVSPSASWAEAWRQAGLSHVLAVSGLHIGLMLALLYLVMGTLRLSRSSKCLLAAVCLIGYGIIIGPRPSVWRAIIMALVGLLAVATKRVRDWPTTLALAAALLLLYDPHLIFDAGFQLSFAATLGILSLSIRLKDYLPVMPLGLDSLISVSLAAQLATLPLVLHYFYLFSPFALVSSLLILPLLPFALGLGLLYFLLPPLSFILAPVCEVFFSLLQAIVSWLAGWPYMGVSLGQPPLILIALYLALLVGLHIRQLAAWHKRLLGVWLIVLLLLISWSPLYRLLWHEHQIGFLAVGAGNAAAIHLPGSKALLFDVGGGYDAAGSRVIVPYLRYRGTTSIPAVFLSHLHWDHILGLEDVLQTFPVGIVYVPGTCLHTDAFGDLLELAARYQVPVAVMWAGEKLDFGSLRVAALLPLVEGYYPDENAGSLVLLVEVSGRRIMFPGDIGFPQEQEISERHAWPLDILVVAHHGSASSSGEQFLRRFTPEHAVISAGVRHGHPAPQAVARLQRYSGDIWHTERQGAILTRIRLRSMQTTSFLP